MRFCRILLSVTLIILLGTVSSRAQFKDKAFSQSMAGKNAEKDSADVMFDIHEFWSGITHKPYRQTPRIGTMFAGSTIFIGAQQINNRQYWKLPIIYGGIGAGIGLGIHYNSMGRGDIGQWCLIGAGLMYWGSLLDGAISFKPDPYPLPGKATIYSILLPGLGQAYNGEYWKIPIYVGGLGAAVHFSVLNNMQFHRFRSLYLESLEPGYDGPVSSESAKYYRDIYRRYRDYSVLAIALVYLIQVIDANVFAYMHDFNVNDNLAMSVNPTVLNLDQQYALNPNPAVGVNLSLRF